VPPILLLSCPYLFVRTFWVSFLGIVSIHICLGLNFFWSLKMMLIMIMLLSLCPVGITLFPYLLCMALWKNKMPLCPCLEGIRLLTQKLRHRSSRLHKWFLKKKPYLSSISQSRYLANIGPNSVSCNVRLYFIYCTGHFIAAGGDAHKIC